MSALARQWTTNSWLHDRRSGFEAGSQYSTASYLPPPPPPPPSPPRPHPTFLLFLLLLKTGEGGAKRTNNLAAREKRFQNLELLGFQTPSDALLHLLRLLLLFVTIEVLNLLWDDHRHYKKRSSQLGGLTADNAVGSGSRSMASSTSVAFDEGFKIGGGIRETRTGGGGVLPLVNAEGLEAGVWQWSSRCTRRDQRTKHDR